MNVTIEEVSKDLRGYVNRAAAGETITIEENGKPLVHLVAEDPAAIRLLAAAKALGWRLPTQPKRHSSEIPRVKLGGRLVSDMVIEDRR